MYRLDTWELRECKESALKMKEALSGVGRLLELALLEVAIRLMSSAWRVAFLGSDV